MARKAAKDEDGDEEAASEASSVPPLTSDDSDDDATAVLLDEAEGALQKEGRPKMLWLQNEDVAVSMAACWRQMTPQQEEEEAREVEDMMRALAQFDGGSMLMRELERHPGRPSEADSPQRGKHMGPRASRAAMVWLQAVIQSIKLLTLAAEALETTFEALKGDLIRLKMAGEYDGMWRLLQPAILENPMLVLEYQAVWLLFQATHGALLGATGTIEATQRMTPEQLTNTLADLSGLPWERVAKRASKPKGYAYLIALVWSFSRTTGYLDYDTQIAAGCIRSDLAVLVWCCG